MNIGIYNLHVRAMGGGEKLTLVLAEHLSSKHNVTLFSAEALDTRDLEQFFDVDLSRVTVVRLTGPGPVLSIVERLRGYKGPAFSLHHYLQIKKLNLDLFINNSYASGLRCPAVKGIFMCMFPHATGSGLSHPLHSYSTVIAISEFSAEWIGKLWHRDPEIVYPPCDEMGPPLPKRKILLNVGRFIADGDGTNFKNQSLLIEAFKQMPHLHGDEWELHFAGSVATDEESRKYTERIQKDARGFPVVFHFNATRTELQNLYQCAPVYWHATGHGFDSNEHPEKQEHFGITTVEAMSAGAVPVVYGSGGQKEIVTHGLDGLLWSDVDDLISQTEVLINDQALQERLGREAISSSRRFSREAFGERVDQLISNFQIAFTS